MFDQMRKNTKTILWVTVIAFVGLIFLAWGADFQLGGKKTHDPGTVGAVNGVPISSQVFEQMVAQARSRYQQQTGREVDDRTDILLRNQTWNDLVQEMLLRQEAQKRGITVTNEEVVYAVLNQPPPELLQNPNLQTDGKFDLAKYQAMLRNPNVDTRALEEQYRGNLPLQKLQMQVVGSISISDEELLDTYRTQNEKIKVSYIMIPAGGFNVDESAITEADLERYYQEHRGSYTQQPSAVLEYVSIPRRHTEQDSLSLVDLGQQVLDELASGEEFDVLVDAYSDAPQSQRGGEDTPFVPAAQISDPAVREAALSLPVGSVSGILTGPAGVHVIKVLDRKNENGGEMIKYADVFLPLKPSPETLAQLRDTAYQFRQEVETRNFADVAAEMKLSVKQTNPFGEGGFIPGLGAAPEFQEFAFRHPVGTISPPVERPDGWVVARIRERRDTRIPELKEVQDRVRQEVTDSLRVAQAAQAAQALLQKVQAGESMAAAAASNPGATYDTTDPFPRLGFPKGLGNDPKVIGPLFAAEVGLYPRPLRGKNAAFVARVDEKIPADLDRFGQQKEQLRQSLMQRRQGRLMDQWMAELKKDADIEDFRFGEFSL